jgi:glyoxylase-like metal-dependent hydrolase (beta-lactamase superfamily II)
MASSSFRFEIGKFECLIVSDGMIMVPSGPPSKTPSPNEKPAARGMDIQCLVIKTGKRNILIDTGCGNSFQASSGTLVKNLKSVGLECGDIDTVIHTHAHSDHVGGNTDDKNRSIFPKAKYIIAKKEWDFWMACMEQVPADKPVIKMMLPTVRKNLLSIKDQFQPVADNAEIIPGLKYLLAPGHTPGNSALTLESGKKKLLCFGDIMHDPIEFVKPEMYKFIDYDGDLALNTRNQILAEYSRPEILFFACHFPFPGIGHIVKKAGVYTWQPLEID